mgnify:CR=1 FL=1
MATTIIIAFEQFLSNTVNLDSEKTKSARASRNWLIDRVHEFETKYDDFPKLYTEKDIGFGSFARRTKKRPLDDIDMMLCMTGRGASYSENGGLIEITVSDNSNLRKLCFDDTDKLSSRKVINKFIEKLKNISQYDNADIHRNQEACTLKLKSYEWNFDIVPCFFTTEGNDGKTFYIIPDGAGNWKKTDPRIDKDKTTRINQDCDGNVLNLIRIVKYWNKRPTMPSIPSYLLENMILNYFDGKDSFVSSYVDKEFSGILDEIQAQIFFPVYDPKGIQGDINTLTIDERDKISTRAFVDSVKASQARDAEKAGHTKSCFSKWQEIFGSEFPKYE